MFQSENKQIFYSKLNNKRIEVYALTTPDNKIEDNSFAKSFKEFSVDNPLQLIKFKFFYNSLFILTKSSVCVYEQLDNNWKKLEAKISFIKESSSKVKIYKLSQAKYLVLNGRNIVVVTVVQDKNLVVKNFRLNSVFLNKLLSYEIKKEFTGDNIHIKCIVNYDVENSRNSLAVQNFILPNLEYEPIINYDILYINTTQEDLLFINAEYFIYAKDKRVFFENFSSKSPCEISELNQISIDYATVINGLLVVFANNRSMLVFSIQNSSASFLNKVDYKADDAIPLKYYCFSLNENKIIFYYTTHNKKTFALIYDNTTKRIDPNKEITFDFKPQIYYKVEEKTMSNVTFSIVNNKHSVIADKNVYYNKVITSIKKFDNILCYLFQDKTFKIFINDNLKYEVNFITNNQHCEIFDYMVILENYFMVLVFDLEEKNTKIISLEFSSRKHSEVFSSSTVFNQFKYLSELNELMLISNYGSIKVFKFGTHCSLQLLGSFSFSFTSTDIAEMRSEFEKKDDLDRVFQLDAQLNLISSYELREVVSLRIEPSQVFEYNLIILVFSQGIVVLVSMKNIYTDIEKIIFGTQIKKDVDNWLKANYSSVRTKVTYDILNNKFDLIN